MLTALLRRHVVARPTIVRACVIALIMTAIALVPHAANAAQMLNDIRDQFRDASSGWMGKSQDYARYFAAALGVIQLTIAGIYLAASGGTLSEHGAKLVKQVLYMSLIWTFINTLPMWTTAIGLTALQMGQGYACAGAAADMCVTHLDPSGVFQQGVHLASVIWQSSDGENMLTQLSSILFNLIACFMVIISYAVLALQLMLTQIEGYIILGVGGVLLGLAMLHIFVGFAERFLSGAIQITLQTIFVFVIAGLGARLATQWMAVFVVADGTTLPAEAYMEVFGAALIFGGIAWKAPQMAATAITGQPSFTAGQSAQFALAMMATTIASVATAISAIRGGVQGIQGALERMEAAKNGGSDATEVAGAIGPDSAAPSPGPPQSNSSESGVSSNSSQSNSASFNSQSSSASSGEAASPSDWGSDAVAPPGGSDSADAGIGAGGSSGSGDSAPGGGSSSSGSSSGGSSSSSSSGGFAGWTDSGGAASGGGGSSSAPANDAGGSSVGGGAAGGAKGAPAPSPNVPQRPPRPRPQRPYGGDMEDQLLRELRNVRPPWLPSDHAGGSAPIRIGAPHH